MNSELVVFNTVKSGREEPTTRSVKLGLPAKPTCVRGVCARSKWGSLPWWPGLATTMLRLAWMLGWIRAVTGIPTVGSGGCGQRDAKGMARRAWICRSLTYARFTQSVRSYRSAQRGRCHTRLLIS